MELNESTVASDQIGAGHGATILVCQGSEFWENFVDPLFKLPTKVVASAWAGHIPFLFPLFKVLRPKVFVELGVHAGSSFIGACSASMAFRTDTSLVGVDSWAGDAHAGEYDGNQVLDELQGYLSRNFPPASLIRSTFDKALPRFAPNSINILYIGSSRAYATVRRDLENWLPKMAADGIILFRDTGVLPADFGVHRLWLELKEQFETIEFFHAQGLGVLFLDPSTNAALQALVSFSKTPAFRQYQDLVAKIADTLGERMGYYETLEERRHLLEERRQLREDSERIFGMLQRLASSKTLAVSGLFSSAWRRVMREARRRSYIGSK
jgi:hypothetical protein